MSNCVEKTILGLIGRLEECKLDLETEEYIISEKKRIKPSSEGIMKFGTHRLKEYEEVYESALDSLVSKRLLIKKNNLFKITDEGKKISDEVRNQWLIDFYDDFLIRSAESKAHALFCEKVFGKNLYQYNVLDIDQLDTMIEKMNLQSNQLVLDIGCGLGKITEYIAEKTGVSLIGIDNAPKIIKWAQKNTKTELGGLCFKVGDINNLAFPKNTFDAIIAIDALYYARDFRGVMQDMKDILKPNGSMGIFYGQGRKPDEAPEKINPENTKLGKAIKENDLQFTTIEFTENAYGVMLRELAIAQELEEMFKEEGNHDICQERIEQSKDLIQRFEKKLQRRYFFYVKK